MKRAAAVAPFIALAALLPALAPPPEPPAESVSPRPPVVSRILAGPGHTLLADGLWLARIGSSGPNGPSRPATLATIITLDPGFDAALRYGATRLAGPRGDLEAALALADRSLRWGPDRPYPWLLKAHLALAYAPEQRPARTADWVRAGLTAGAQEKWLVALLARLRRQAGQARQLERDLARLAREAPAPSVRRAARERLRR